MKKNHKKKKKKSRFSLFRHKVSDVFKDMVEPPCEDICEDIEETKDETKNEKEESTLKPIDEQVTEAPEEPEKVEEPEQTPNIDREDNAAHEEIVGTLNSAVAEWKQTGEVGLHLEPPVPFSTKLKTFWARVKPTDVSVKVKDSVNAVASTVASGIEKVKSMKLPRRPKVKIEPAKVLEKPKIEPVVKPKIEEKKPAWSHIELIVKQVKKRLHTEKAEDIVRKEWEEIATKTVDTRAEIENIYKQLSGK